LIPPTFRIAQEGFFTPQVKNGEAAAYSANVNGQTLTFEFANGVFRDKETDNEWDIFGRAASGALQGTQLTEKHAINHFWLSWAAFRPETQVYTP